MALEGKNIIVAVSGGIAAYKAAELVSRLKKRGSAVRVIMTEAAAEFINPLTFQSLTGFPVRKELFLDWSESYIPHIDNATWADAIMVVPATANIIAKIACGIADDLVTTTILAAGDIPVLIAPAMNTRMYNNPIYRKNIEYLEDVGFHTAAPEAGPLACGETGKGRLANIETIINSIEGLFVDRDYEGLRFLITAGGTREPIDPVRFISNRSSGKTGYALAQAASRRGGQVLLISTPSCLTPPAGVETIQVETAGEMLKACEKYFSESDIIIKTAAVADFEPVHVEEQKIKKEDGQYNISLKKTKDILKTLSNMRTHQFLVGFCAETENLEKNALKKLSTKKLDMIVANDVSKGIFGSDSTSIIILDPSGGRKKFENISKTAANNILDSIKVSMNGIPLGGKEMTGRYFTSESVTEATRTN